MITDNFAVFILTHGRPNQVFTYSTLKKAGYTGDIYIIVDDEDSKKNEYFEVFGDQVIIFSKKEISMKFDEADNFDDRRSIVYARNACFDIAKDLGIEYFMQLDDDYVNFFFKYDGSGYSNQSINKNLDEIINLYLKYYKSINAKSIAMAQNGDFIGGAVNDMPFSINRRRKAMNTFICSTNRRFYFKGRINEDVNTYTHNSSIGDLFLTIPVISINQKTTQSSKGGMTDIYLDNGTYVKSFYTILFMPSAVKIGLMGDNHRRLHHKINWKYCVPKIINEELKKK